MRSGHAFCGWIVVAAAVVVSGCGAWPGPSWEAGAVRTLGPNITVVCSFGVESAAILASAPAATDDLPEWRGTASSGPRFGVVHVTGGEAERLEAEHGAKTPLTVCGWSFRFQTEYADDTLDFVDFIPYVAGLEQGLALAGVSLLFGRRTSGGLEWALGPDLYPDGMGYAVSVGRAFRTGEMVLPADLTFAWHGDGMRVSVNVGWNLRR